MWTALPQPKQYKVLIYKVNAYPAMQVQWAERISLSFLAINHASWALSGELWLGFTLAFKITIFFPGTNWRENIVLTYPAWK